MRFCTVIILGLITLVACKKKNTDDSQHDKVVGIWTATNLVIDSNQNHALDASEYGVFPGTAPSFEFKGDGSASIPGKTLPPAASLSWVLVNSDADLRLVTDSAGVKDSVLLHIASATEMTAYQLTTIGATYVDSWVVFKKQ